MIKRSKSKLNKAHAIYVPKIIANKTNSLRDVEAEPRKTELSSSKRQATVHAKCAVLINRIFSKLAQRKTVLLMALKQVILALA